MKVVILWGGRGTRIRDIADDLPKPMIPIGDLPILWHLMKSYARAGHRDFILCLGYKAQVIKEFFLNYEAHTTDFTLTLGPDKAIEYHGDHDEAGWRAHLAAGLKIVEDHSAALPDKSVRDKMRYRKRIASLHHGAARKYLPGARASIGTYPVFLRAYVTALASLILNMKP